MNEEERQKDKQKQYCGGNTENTNKSPGMSAVAHHTKRQDGNRSKGSQARPKGCQMGPFLEVTIG